MRLKSGAFSALSWVEEAEAPVEGAKADADPTQAMAITAEVFIFQFFLYGMVMRCISYGEEEDGERGERFEQIFFCGVNVCTRQEEKTKDTFKNLKKHAKTHQLVSEEKPGS